MRFINADRPDIHKVMFQMHAVCVGGAPLLMI